MGWKEKAKMRFAQPPPPTITKETERLAYVSAIILFIWVRSAKRARVCTRFARVLLRIL